MWVKVPLGLGWNRLAAAFRWDVGRVGISPPIPWALSRCHMNQLCSCQWTLPHVGLLLKKKKIWVKLRCEQECTRWIFTGRRKSPKASPKMKILAAMDLGGWKMGICASPRSLLPIPTHTLLVWLL